MQGEGGSEADGEVDDSDGDLDDSDGNVDQTDGDADDASDNVTNGASAVAGAVQDAYSQHRREDRYDEFSEDRYDEFSIDGCALHQEYSLISAG